MFNNYVNKYYDLRIYFTNISFYIFVSGCAVSFIATLFCTDTFVIIECIAMTVVFFTGSLIALDKIQFLNDLRQHELDKMKKEYHPYFDIENQNTEQEKNGTDKFSYKSKKQKTKNKIRNETESQTNIYINKIKICKATV